MRPTPWLDAERYRIQTDKYRSEYGDDFGAFAICRFNGDLRMLVTSGDKQHPWEHVSVSLKDRCPTWPEMCRVKALFWLPEETVMQLHVPDSQHINIHSFALHLWRPWHLEIPLPPTSMV